MRIIINVKFIVENCKNLYKTANYKSKMLTFLKDNYLRLQ